MASRKKQGSSLTAVEAVQALYTTLEPLDEPTRQRVLQSALSLLGMGQVSPPAGLHTPVSSSAASPTPSSGSRPVSIVELIQDKQPATNSQRIALFAYYREKYENENRFSRGNLKAYFSKAKEPAPGNFDRDFADAVRSGWVHEDGSESYLTSKGLEVVEAGFGGKARPRGRSGPKKGKSSKKAVGAGKP